MEENNKIYDLVISGGGMMGTSLALMLSKENLKILVIDSNSSIVKKEEKCPDIRVSAINFSSIKLLDRMEIWKKIKKYHYKPYQKLEFWDNSSRIISFHSSSINLSKLGIIIENYRLREAILKKCLEIKELKFLTSSHLSSIKYEKNIWFLTLNNGLSYRSRFLIGADGYNSWIRQKIKIKTIGGQYKKSCLSLIIERKEANQQDDTVWQFFHPSGPRAFLPMYDKWASLFWYDDTSYIYKLENLPIKKLEQEIKKHFPERIGDFILHRRKAFPIFCYYPIYCIKPGLALIGDSAHTINPIAGQGANLGFRDVEVLANLIIKSKRKHKNWNKKEILERYQKRRRLDTLFMQTGINLCYFLFISKNSKLIMIRNFGLLLFSKLKKLRNFLSRYASGI